MQTRQQMENEIDSLIKASDSRRRDGLQKAFSGFDNGAEMLRMARTIQPGMRKGSFLAQATGEIKPFDASAAGPGDLLASRTQPAEAFGEMLQQMYPDLTNVMRPVEEPLPWDLPNSSTRGARSTGKVVKAALKAAIAALAAPLHAHGWIETGLDSPNATADAVTYKHPDWPGNTITVNFSNGAWSHEDYDGHVASGKGAHSLGDWVAEVASNEGTFGSKKVGFGSRLTKVVS